MDVSLSEVIDRMNAHPAIEVLDSCVGQYSACLLDRAYAEWNMEQYDKYRDVFCTSSSVPFIQFRFQPEQKDINAFMGRCEWDEHDLSKALGLPPIVKIQSKDGVCTIHHPQLEEQLDEDWMVPGSIPPRPPFAEFWCIVVDAWNKSMTPEFAIKHVPDKFPLTQKCAVCGNKRRKR